jgi:hypothetical protein
LSTIRRMTIQSISINERLGQFLEGARDWERKATSILGLFILKLPGLRGNPPSVVIELILSMLQVQKERSCHTICCRTTMDQRHTI